MATKFETDVLTSLGELKTAIVEHSRRLEKIETSNETIISKFTDQSIDAVSVEKHVATLDGRVTTLEAKVDKLRVGVLKICIFIALSGGTGAVGAGIVEFIKNTF